MVTINFWCLKHLTFDQQGFELALMCLDASSVAWPLFYRDGAQRERERRQREKGLLPHSIGIWEILTTFRTFDSESLRRQLNRLASQSYRCRQGLINPGR